MSFVGAKSKTRPNVTNPEAQNKTMLRRPPTSIELKLDDIAEFEEMRQQVTKDQTKPGKSYNQLPDWQPGPKTKEEIQERIGYVPVSQLSTPPAPPRQI